MNDTHVAAAALGRRGAMKSRLSPQGETCDRRASLACPAGGGWAYVIMVML